MTINVIITTLAIGAYCYNARVRRDHLTVPSLLWQCTMIEAFCLQLFASAGITFAGTTTWEPRIQLLHHSGRAARRYFTLES
jgi:hypothetical protein